MNEPGASERRPLHRAAGSNQTQICELLIKKGATIEQVGFLVLLIVIRLSAVRNIDKILSTAHHALETRPISLYELHCIGHV